LRPLPERVRRRALVIVDQDGDRACGEGRKTGVVAGASAGGSALPRVGGDARARPEDDCTSRRFRAVRSMLCRRRSLRCSYSKVAWLAAPPAFAPLAAGEL